MNTRKSFWLLIGSLLFATPLLAVDFSPIDVCQSNQVYTQGDRVKTDQQAYQANWWTQNQNPGDNSGQWQVWQRLGSCDGGDGGNQKPVAEANGPYSALVAQDITFSSDGSSDPDGTISRFQWDFGNGQSSTQANPVYQYAQAGQYTVSLTVTDDDGATTMTETQATITTEDGGGNCVAPQYVAGASYQVGDEVSNVGRRFQCNIAGWCSSDAAWAYEPGIGAHWQDAWQDQGPCNDNGGENQLPQVSINGPYTGRVDQAVLFSSRGSVDADGNIVEYLWRFGDGAESNNANPSHVYQASGVYTAQLTLTDDQGAMASETTRVTISEKDSDSPLPEHLLVGYWHNFDNGSGVINMADVDAAWDFINVSFAENKPGGAEGEVAFVPFAETDEAFIQGVRYQQSLGKKVLISLGGANAHIQLNSDTARENFVRTMGDIIERYGFDGMDIDLEGGSLNMTAGDTIDNPKTPAIVNLIAATKRLKSRFGSGFILTMAPETAYVQGGLSNFSGIWGAYLPLIHALRDDLTLLHVQHYNTGSLTATDGNIYSPGTVDFHVAMSDMLLTGFNAGGEPDNYFPPLRPDQVAVGLPSGTSSASSGYTSPDKVHQSLNCLMEQLQCQNYQPAQAYPMFRGLMTWSINWDAHRGNEFSAPHRAFLDQKF